LAKIGATSTGDPQSETGLTTVVLVVVLVVEPLGPIVTFGSSTVDIDTGLP
jgi:hypothetical protein